MLLNPQGAYARAGHAGTLCVYINHLCVLVQSLEHESLSWSRLVGSEKVGAILCLQQDSDMEYFGLDLRPILRRVEERADVSHTRFRINDFDAFDLRNKLPEAAAVLAREVQKGKKAYVHCTAGVNPVFCHHSHSSTATKNPCSLISIVHLQPSFQHFARCLVQCRLNVIFWLS